MLHVRVLFMAHVPAKLFLCMVVVSIMTTAATTTEPENNAAAATAWEIPVNFKQEDLVCPIGHEFFKCVALACDGFHYEHENIKNWFKTCGSVLKSPSTNNELQHSTLFPDTHMQTIVDFTRNQCVRSFVEWKKTNKRFELLEDAVEKMTSVLCPRELVDLCTEKDLFEFLEKSSNPTITTLLKTGGILCTKCSKRLNYKSNTNLCLDCAWLFIDGKTTIACEWCKQPRSNTFCKKCGPMPQFVKTDLIITNSTDPATQFFLAATSRSMVHVCMSHTHVMKNWGSCASVITAAYAWERVTFKCERNRDESTESFEETKQVFATLKKLMSVFPNTNSHTIYLNVYE